MQVAEAQLLDNSFGPGIDDTFENEPTPWMDMDDCEANLFLHFSRIEQAIKSMCCPFVCLSHILIFLPSITSDLEQRKDDARTPINSNILHEEHRHRKAVSKEPSGSPFDSIPTRPVATRRHAPARRSFHMSTSYTAPPVSDFPLQFPAQDSPSAKDPTISKGYAKRESPKEPTKSLPPQDRKSVV